MIDLDFDSYFDKSVILCIMRPFISSS